MIAFGPVPSRRLGRSLGINNIPPKACSYSCVYCQVGRSPGRQVHRRGFYGAAQVVREVRDKVQASTARGERIDYLTFVPDGEPTLDIDLGREIELLSESGIKIAVITNGSLMHRADVRDDLTKAEWVCLKIDSTCEEVWRHVNRPHPALQLDSILAGMLEFARAYAGQLVTETLLVQGVNDCDGPIAKIADFLDRLAPAKAYLSIPTRPPAEAWVQPPRMEQVYRAFHLLHDKVEKVEYLIGYEGNAFAHTGDLEHDLLSITAVHPMREDAVSELLARTGGKWSGVHELIARGQLVEMEYQGRKFYMRRPRGRASPTAATCPTAAAGTP